MGRTVYALLCHSADDQILDLFRYLNRPEDCFVLHIDAKANPRLHAIGQRLRQLFANVAVVESRLCSWGGYSLVRATFAMMVHAVKHFGEWDHFTLLSESHLPLWPPSQLAEMQTTDVSWIATHAVAGLDANGQADVAHRLSRFYRELPGVGAFGCQDRKFPESVMSDLHHGSQWVSLSRRLCLSLLNDEQCHYLLAAFSTALLSDELAIPTMVMATKDRLKTAILQRNPSYVAWPHLGASNDMIFAEHNFFAARDAGHLFIRKRPAQLSETISTLVEKFAFCSRPELIDRLGELPRSDAYDQISLQERNVGDGFAALLSREFPQFQIERLNPRLTGNTPAIFFKLTGGGLHTDVAVAILSADLINYKLVLALLGNSSERYGSRDIGHFKLAMIKARIHTLAYYKEVLLENPYDFGFIRIADRRLEGLMEPLTFYLAQAKEISHDLAGGASESVVDQD